ncbi:MAG: hypothetical protein M1587_12055 [Thaumarchaeota archaeon]|nr:hypothetical protein [Nitrososphaerota archaeon]
MERFPPENAGIIRRNWRVLLRIFFALVWCVDAYFKWLFVYYGGSFANVVSSASQSQPLFAQRWISFWLSISLSSPNFSLLIAIFETVIAGFLLLGLFTPLISALGIIFNLLIWSTAEGFGGIFQPGATDIGTGPLYAAIFAGLIVIQAGRQKGLDRILHEKLPQLPFW